MLLFKLKVSEGQQHRITFPKKLIDFKKPIKGKWIYNPHTRIIVFTISEKEGANIETLDQILELIKIEKLLESKDI